MLGRFTVVVSQKVVLFDQHTVCGNYTVVRLYGPIDLNVEQLELTVSSDILQFRIKFSNYSGLQLIIKVGFPSMVAGL